jgi:hypothetical protein
MAVATFLNSRCVRAANQLRFSVVLGRALPTGRSIQADSGFRWLAMCAQGVFGGVRSGRGDRDA